MIGAGGARIAATCQDYRTAGQGTGEGTTKTPGAPSTLRETAKNPTLPASLAFLASWWFHPAPYRSGSGDGG